MEQLQSLAADDAGDEAAAARTRDPRESMLLMASLRVPGGAGAAMTLKVRNLSAGGLMAECDRRVTAGERVEIELRNVGWVEGAVAWAAAGRIGVRFDRAIDPKAARKPVATPGVQTSKIIVGMDGRRPGLRF